ncbi:MAG: DUF3737 family protein [Prevotellaceae bacterium]|jgi:hypothetical protein|nr:DUF3737 family protein [Prevotellaceae bacterium]
MEEIIVNTFFEGERPLYAVRDTRLENVKFYPGESPVKESRNIVAHKCEFMSKYPFWHNDGLLIDDCLFTVYSRAAIWYSKNVRMTNTLVEAPKMFRKISRLDLSNVRLTSAAECCWYCRDIKMKDVEVKGGDYIFMNSCNIELDGLRLQGNYSFQDAKNIVIRNSYLDSKDAFWETENVTVYDSVITGEYLGWHSRNLSLINCKISGTQPLCYAAGLKMTNCEMDESADLCFEYSDLIADINSHVTSIKNPDSGHILARSIGEIIIDKNSRYPGQCEIETEWL